MAQACRPMADYLFGEALGAPLFEDDLRAAKDALTPLRDHPGRIGWAVTVLLEGGESMAAYEDAVSVLLHAARGVRADAIEGMVDQESVAIISLLPRLRGSQLTFPGLDD